VTDENKPEPPDLWDRAARGIYRFGPLPTLGVITVITVMMYGIVFWGETNGDDLTFHMAEAKRIADCLRIHDWDFWNPSGNAGYASAYYYQVVPQLAAALPAAVFGHFQFWFQLSLFLPHVLAPAAAYRGARLLGATPWEAVIAAQVIAMTSGASKWGSGADGTFQVGLYTQTWALCAFPLALGHGARWIRDGKSIAPAIAWGAFVGLCHPFAGLALAMALFLGVSVRWFGRFAIDGPFLRTGVSLLPVAAIAIALAEWRDGAWTEPVFVAGVAVGVVAVVSSVIGLVIGERVVWWGSQRLAGIVLGVLGAGVVIACEALHRPTDKVWVIAGVLLCGGCLVLLEIPRMLAIVVTLAAIAGLVYARTLDDLDPLIEIACKAAAVMGIGVYMLRRQPDTTWRTEITHELRREVVRLLVLGGLLAVATMPGWLTLVVDYAGFGGFPHRVDDEVGPGFGGLLFGRSHPDFVGYFQGAIFDYRRHVYVITAALPIVILAARGPFLRWLWPAGLAFAALLAAGPHIGTTQDDLFPMVRFLGAMQVVLGLAIGAGAITVGRALWLWPRWKDWGIEYGARTAIAAVGAALGVFVVTGVPVIADRVHILEDYDNRHREELMSVIDALRKEPEGRKQTGLGAESHWWNLLPYVYADRPALLQMGGGGLQSSPNYDFLWNLHDHLKSAWLYDAPYLVFAKTNADKMPAGEKVMETEHYELRKLPAPGLVSPVEVTGTIPPGTRKGQPGHEAALEWLKTDMPLKDHVLAYDGFGDAGAPAAGKTITSSRQDSPGDEPDIVAEVDATAKTTFMVRESWHPRWRGYIDGAEVPVRRVTPDFPAIDVPAGRHKLSFRFDRPWWANASWLAWPLTVIGAWLFTRRRRAKRPKVRVIDRVISRE